MSQYYYYLLAFMYKNIPDSCWDNDPSAPWNDIQVNYSYILSINLGGFVFNTEEIKETVTFGHFEIRTEEDQKDLEYDLYMIIEDNLDPEIKEQDYYIKVLN